MMIEFQRRGRWFFLKGAETSSSMMIEFQRRGRWFFTKGAEAY